MPMVFIRHVGANLAYVEPVGPVDPGFGQGGGEHPSHGLPWGPGHVSPPIYHPGHPDHGLPTVPGHPGNALPGAPGSPGNELPAAPPPHVPAGTVLVLVRDAGGVWHYATTAPGTPPPTTLPEPPNAGVWPPPGHVSGQPVPVPPGGTVTPPIAPTPAPKR